MIEIKKHTNSKNILLLNFIINFCISKNIKPCLNYFCKNKSLKKSNIYYFCKINTIYNFKAKNINFLKNYNKNLKDVFSNNNIFKKNKIKKYFINHEIINKNYSLFNLKNLLTLKYFLFCSSKLKIINNSINLNNYACLYRRINNNSFFKNYFYNNFNFLNKFIYKQEQTGLMFFLNDLTFNTVRYCNPNIKISEIVCLNLFTYNLTIKFFNKLTIFYFYELNPKVKLFFRLKKSLFNIKFFLKNLILNNDFFLINKIAFPINFIFNKYLIKYNDFFDLNSGYLYNSFNLNSSYIGLSACNYYPVIFLNSKSYSTFFKNLKSNYNLNYLHLTNKLLVNFLENLLKKNVFLKLVNNRFNKINNYYLNILLNEYKNFQPQYFKNYLFSDFLTILWYSFFLKDLKLISQWVSQFMETLNFKNHKKFVNFFQNFILKYSSLFIDVLKVKGFFFDIRGKVGVTGSSKKRHLSFKFGSINRSSKKFKMNFNQNLVRTYSGVLGLTYIICF